MTVLKFVGWTGFAAYTALVIYGLYTLEFKVMLPWLILENGLIATIFALFARSATKEAEDIAGSLKYS